MDNLKGEEIEYSVAPLFTLFQELPASAEAHLTPNFRNIPHRRECLTSFDMFGSCSMHNVKRIMRINKTLKPVRLNLLKQVLALCEKAHIVPFVYGGTALSVFRENGQMIPHDTDIDLAVLEYDSANGQGAFSKICTYCLDNAISLVGVKNLNQTGVDSLIHVDLSGSIQKRFWLEKDLSTHELREIPYDGLDCKRAKFYFTSSGLKQMCEQFGLKLRHFNTILSDPGLVHVDLFTLSKHPDNPDTHLRVNWSLPYVYDCNRKQFPIMAIIPYRECVFEQINLMAPADLQLYLTLEYGYLGRDAQYDRESQLYVPIPKEFIPNLPYHMKLDADFHANQQPSKLP